MNASIHQSPRPRQAAITVAREVRRWLPFWAASGFELSSWLDECDAPGRSFQIEWLGLVFSVELGRRADGAIRHNDAIFADTIPVNRHTLEGAKL